MKGKRIMGFIFSIAVLVFFACEEKTHEFTRMAIARKVEKKIEAPKKIRLEASQYASPDTITLKWNAVEGADYYIVYQFDSHTETITEETNPIKRVKAHVKQMQHVLEVKVEKMPSFFVVRAVTGDKKTGKFVPMKDKKGRIVESSFQEGKTFAKIGLGETLITFHSVRLSWGNVEGANAYVIKRKKDDTKYKKIAELKREEEDYFSVNVVTSSSMSYKKKLDISGELEFTDTELEADTSYDYTIIAQRYDEDGTLIVENSKEYTLTTDEQNAPHKVENFVASVYEHGDMVKLTWESPKTLQGKEEEQNTIVYRVYRRQENGHTFRKIGDVETDVQGSGTKNPYEFLDKNMEVGRFYEYQVIAYYGEENDGGRPSDIARGASIPQPIEGKGEILSDEGENRKRIKIRWNSGILEQKEGVSIKIERMFSDDEKTTKEIHINDPATEAYEDTDDLNPGEYSYTVRYIKTMEGEKRAEGKPTTIGGLNVPSSESILTSYEVSRNKRDEITIRWNVNDNVDSKINVQVQQLTNGAFVDVLDKKNITTKEITIRAEEVLKRWYRLKLTFMRDGSPTVVLTTPKVGSTLYVPQNVRTSKSTSIDYVEVSWDASPEVDGYEMQVVEVAKMTTASKAVTTSKARTFFVPNTITEKPMQVQSTGDETQLSSVQKSDGAGDKRIKVHYFVEKEKSKNGTFSFSVRTKYGSNYSNYSVAEEGSVFGSYGMNVEATEGEYADKIKIKWNTVPHAEKYTIERRRKSEGKNDAKSIATIASVKSKNEYEYEDTSATFSEVVSGEKVARAVEYVYTITPKKGKLRAPEGRTATGYALYSPFNVQASRSIHHTRIRVSWRKVEGAEEYSIYASSQPDGIFEKIKTISQPNNAMISYWHEVGKEKERYYKIITHKKGTKSALRTTSSLAGKTMGQVTLFASDRAKALGFSEGASTEWNAKDLYVAVHGASEAQHDGTQFTGEVEEKSNPLYKIDRNKHYATKLEWKDIEGADTYHIFRMDFNEYPVSWRKIGERKKNKNGSYVFFDAEALVLRAHKALYWVLASKKTNNGVFYDASISDDDRLKKEINIGDAIQHQKKSTIFANMKQYIVNMIPDSNVAVGSRQITPKEQLSWGLYELGRAILKEKNLEVEVKKEYEGRGTVEIRYLVYFFVVREKYYIFNTYRYNKESDISIYTNIKYKVFKRSGSIFSVHDSSKDGDYTNINVIYKSDLDNGKAKEVRFVGPYGEFFVFFGSKGVYPDFRSDGSVAIRIPYVKKKHKSVFGGKSKIGDETYAEGGAVMVYGKDTEGFSAHNPKLVMYLVNGGPYKKVLEEVYGTHSSRKPSP